ncbi:secretory immunoglobulin A-binding protein EsiB [bacterium MnTg02]|nr:secretory immunoglobulin A-binding protein EsiB [bacterium MnTg02]
MRNFMRTTLLACVLSLCPVASGSAGPVEDGTLAFVRGDYATALRLLRPLAEQGDAKAQFNLGVMYVRGAGVPRDHVVAHKWLNLAANRYPASEENWRIKTTKLRKVIATLMTPAQIAEAQRLAREWKPKKK